MRTIPATVKVIKHHDTKGEQPCVETTQGAALVWMDTVRQRQGHINGKAITVASFRPFTQQSQQKNQEYSVHLTN